MMMISIVLLLSLITLTYCLLKTRRSYKHDNSRIYSINNNHNIRNIRKSQLYMGGPGADYIPDDLPQIDYDKLPKIDPNTK
jgi:hypothetical protein